MNFERVLFEFAQNFDVEVKLRSDREFRELGRRGCDLAAEASGHVIQKHVGPSGDGLATAVLAIGVCLLAPFRALLWKMAPLAR